MYQYNKKYKKMINYDDVTKKKSIKELNPNWPLIPIIHTKHE